MHFLFILLTLVVLNVFAWETVPGKSPPMMIGTSSETKPVLGLMAGSMFFESDTTKWYMWTGDKDGTSSDWKQAGEGVVLMNALAFEDQTNSVGKMEQQFSYRAGVTADTQVKASAGFVHTVTCGSDAAATAGTLEIRDATAAGAGTVVFTWTFTTTEVQPRTVVLDAVFATGIYLDFTTTADVTCTVSYR